MKYKRYCKTLSLKQNPLLIEDYKKVHGPGAVWPEITQGMKDVGIIDMEIYINDNQLFMIMDTKPNGRLYVTYRCPKCKRKINVY